MKIDTFLAVLQQEIDAFQKDWKKWMEHFPTEDPALLDETDWREQFEAFLNLRKMDS